MRPRAPDHEGMNEGIQRQKQLIDRSGLGLLPGLALAFALALVVMAALLIQSWWVTVCVLVTLFAVTGVVVWVVLKVADDGPGEPQ